MITQKSLEGVTYTILDDPSLPSWDNFVHQQPQASIYHLSLWQKILSEAFGKRWYLIVALQQQTILAGLPLVHMKHWLFGNFLTSMPYFNYGGILAVDTTCSKPLLEYAATFQQSLQADYIELRHLENHYPELPHKQEKVSMWLDLPPDSQSLLGQFKAKLRSQILKGKKNKLQAFVGGVEFLEQFYRVFAQNMRDLGTPVYSRKFFRLILEAFPEAARLVVVQEDTGVPVAAGFLLGYKDRLEIPWASSVRQYNHLQTNMWLYWSCLEYACQHNYRIFDFGRSTYGSSTYKFKQQWGAYAVPHFWHYHLAERGKLPNLSPNNQKFQAAINLWRHLPIKITCLLGPSIVKHIP